MRLKEIIKHLKMKKLLIILCLPLILFTACNRNDGTTAIPDNNKTEISDTLDENGNRGECIRNSYTVYDDSTNNYQQYGKCITYCDVDEYIYSNGFRKYMLCYKFRYNYDTCFYRFIFYEGELPYLSEFLDSCINYKKGDVENDTKHIWYELMAGTGFLISSGSNHGIAFGERLDNLNACLHHYEITPLELKKIVADGREKIAELRRNDTTDILYFRWD